MILNINSPKWSKGIIVTSPDPSKEGSDSPDSKGMGPISPDPWGMGFDSPNPKGMDSISPDPWDVGFASPDPWGTGSVSPDPGARALSRLTPQGRTPPRLIPRSAPGLEQERRP
jgi:hypothetical protein